MVELLIGIIIIGLVVWFANRNYEKEELRQIENREKLKEKLREAEEKLKSEK